MTSLSRIGEGNGSPLQGSCLENPRDGGGLVGCRLWGRTESDTTAATRQQRQQQVALVVKSLLASARDIKRRMFDPWVGKIPLEESMATILAILPGESHRQRRLAGYSP